ncbi:hypothetical protein COCON_G00228640 [Conger conger]|uniref:Calponin-homology (CH) domain-containing protein n=1 Tax=Conger conger TaxID=82655 RepID=A0A9Q1HMJ1_CONCO|nr:hypothetical protein COCON_G00228640 [Conger conger]
MPSPGRALSPALSCQLSLKPACGYRGYPERSPPGRTKESQDSKIYTDWANHYLAKSGCPRLIKDLTQDIADGVLLAEIIQIIAEEKVEDIHGCPRSQSQMIHNVDSCLSFLEARGLNVQGVSAEEIGSGNLRSILGLFFILSRYKQQQQHQHQYYQSLVELQQHVTHLPTGAALENHPKAQDMQSSLTARYASPPPHSGIAAGQKKNTRLPGPSRLPAAGGGGSKVQAAANLNRRSQSFTSTDRGKPLQYCSSNDREAAKGIPLPGSVTGSPAPPSPQLPVSALPPPPRGSPAAGPGHAHKPPQAEAPSQKGAGGGQRSMLEKFRLINNRGNCRPGAELREEEEEALSEYGEEAQTPPAPPKQPAPAKTASKAPGGKALPQPKDREDKPKGKSKAVASREEKEPATEPTKKTSKIASLIPKGGKSSSSSSPASAPRKEAAPAASSGIPKPGLKGSPSCPGRGRGRRPSPGGGRCATPPARWGAPPWSPPTAPPPCPSPRRPPPPPAPPQPRPRPCQRARAAAPPADQPPQHRHRRPFMYRTHSENDCTAVAPADSPLSPTKTELAYSKTAKQCLEEISGR